MNVSYVCIRNVDLSFTSNIEISKSDPYFFIVLNSEIRCLQRWWSLAKYILEPLTFILYFFLSFSETVLYVTFFISRDWHKKNIFSLSIVRVPSRGLNTIRSDSVNDKAYIRNLFQGGIPNMFCSEHGLTTDRRKYAAIPETSKKNLFYPYFYLK